MPLREFGCHACGTIIEIYHPSINPLEVERPSCPKCGDITDVLFSTAHLDTSSSFKAFDVKIEGQNYHIGNLHELRAVEKAFDHKNLRFDAWSENPSSEAYGPEYNPRDPNAPVQPPRKAWGLPTMKDA